MAKTLAAGTVFKVATVVVGNLTSITPPGMNKTEIETTDFASLAAEFLMSIPDHGEMQLEGFWNYTDAGQAILLGDANDAAAPVRSCEVECVRQAVQFTFNAYIKSFTLGVQVNDVYKFTSALRVTGVVTPSAYP